MVEQIKTRVYWGPNLLAPFAAVVAEFEKPKAGQMPVREFSQLLAELYPDLPSLELKLTRDTGDIESFAAVLANTWQERVWQNSLPPPVIRSDAEQCRIAIGFYDRELAADMLVAAVHMTKVVFAHAFGSSSGLETLTPTIQRILNLDYGRPLSKTAAKLCRISRARGIPVYPVSEAAGIQMYGQGARGLQFREMANQQDSVTGFVLGRRKDLTAGFLRRLGFPVTNQQTVKSESAAREICGNIGFPLVVKPVDRGKGIGVSVGINTLDQLNDAFRQARASSYCREVVVERYVPGADHRLNVLAGKFVSAIRLLPPKIIGDGKQTIAALIEELNIRRSKDSAASYFLSRLTVDESMLELLRRQGFELNDQPPAGHELRLRNTSNLHTGGVREDATAEIHPDNTEMAEAIARGLHAEAIGIDFISPDISKPWHETRCAIIEVNNNPGIFIEEVLERYLLEKFPVGDDGRVPSILVVGNDEETYDGVIHHLEACEHRVGHTSGNLTRVAGQLRFPGPADLPSRVLGLVLDSSCEAFVVRCTADEIMEFGLAHMRYDLALVTTIEPLKTDMLQLINDNATQVIERASASMLGDRILPLINNFLNRSTQA